MENEGIELDRFRRKAHGYREAQRAAPGARIFEICVICAILDGYCQRKGVTRNQLIVVDLMAGTGFLCDWLYKAGFRRLHAFEACNEMSQSAFVEGCPPTHFELHPFADFDGVRASLGQIRPHVIICLAGFHHLICYTSDGQAVDSAGSVKLQTSVASMCIESLEEEGIVLIGDVYENGLDDTYIGAWPYWSCRKSVAQLLRATPVPEVVRQQIVATTNPRAFSERLETCFAEVPRKPNPSLNWFRQVVGSRSPIGHMDAALSRGLLDELACTYHLSFATVRCPWIFDSRGSLEKYIVTFWFEGARGNDEQVRRILADASRVNGLPTSWSVAGFGWNLGFAVLERRNSGVGGVARAAVRRVVALLGILLGITFVNLCLKCLTYHSGLYDALDQIIIVVLAVASGEVVAEWRRRVEMRETHVLNDPMPQQPSTSPPLSSLSD